MSLKTGLEDKTGAAEAWELPEFWVLNDWTCWKEYFLYV
jgi:hypothetical protein